jgi:glycosyltransferase involved in cell wall biosynthesis
MTDINYSINYSRSKTNSVNGGFVAILLGTYNGEKFLAEQLDSLENQTHKNWIIIASDDGSTDRTLEILQQYQAKWPVGKLTVLNGPKKGFCQNFLSLACNNIIRADYYAFCDQDDVWFDGKIERITQKFNEILEKSSKEIELLKEYKTALISAVVTGKVDLRNYNN